MADFKTALESLAKGDLELETLSKQLTKLLEQSPQYATRMLAQLDEVHDGGKINDQVYAKLKGQINQYRRSHAVKTEGEATAGDATVFDQEGAPAGQAAPEKTEVLSDNDKQSTFDVTGSSDQSGVDIDISTPDTSDTSTQAITSATGPAGTEWSDPSASAYQPGQELGPGSIIKHRFKLLEVLGVGGMGKVYKGIDLLKEEARDRNPYVAIKLLNEDFRDHPEAFISLQRESSRQQKLAHPNIATVYDFDRIGGPGTPVFITMELMEGMELKDFIKKDVRKKGGLPFAEAFQIIKQLGDALTYAHNRGLVHSDFKPGNAFLCNDGTVKTLDFGIARAVKNPVTGEAEKTLFDPGKLGALTPAYASLEMLEGSEPDTRDDTYALGCVAYELLTGKHPFNKLPANKAMENNLVPAPVKGLKKKQNRALRRAVAFHRKDRSPSVEHFIEELEARYIWYKHPPTIAAIVALLAIGIGTFPVMQYYHKQEINQIITDIKTGSPKVIVDRLAMIGQYEKSEQLTITDEAKDSIQSYFKTEIGKLIDTSGDKYNFPKADKILTKQIYEYYPDSSFYTQQKALIEDSKKKKLSQLYGEFSEALKVAREQKDPSLLVNTKGILETIRTRIDPNDPLLTDERPGNRYRILADNEFDNGNYDQALALVSDGLAVAPKNQQLMDTQKKIEKQIKVVALQQKIGSIQGQLTALADYKNVESDIKDLASLNPGDPLLRSLAVGMKENIDQEISNLKTTGTRADAETLAKDYGDLLTALQLNRELTQIKLAHLEGEERTKVIQQIVSNDKSSIDKLLGAPKLDDDTWKSNLLAGIQELDSLSDESAGLSQDLAGIRKKVANLYIDQANKTLKENRFDAALALVDSGDRFAPGLSELLTTRNAITDARAAHEKQLTIEGLKKDFEGQIQGNQVVKALEYFNQLKQEMPADDPFITTEGPTAIANSYAVLAKSRSEAKDYDNALKLADEGLKYNPDNDSLKKARNEYAVEVNAISIIDTLKTSVSINVKDISSKLGEMESVSPGRYSKVRQDAINALMERINKIRTTDQNTAATLAQAGASIFPGTAFEKLRDEIKPKPWPEKDTARVALVAGKLTEATAIQNAAAAEFTGHPDFVAFSDELAQKKADALQTFQLYQSDKEAAGNDYDKLVAARALLRKAQAIWTDNPDYTAEEENIGKLIAANSPVSKKVIQREEVNIEEAVAKAKTEEPGKVAEAWKPLSSGRECNSKLAGYGKRAKAICFDLVNTGWRGPLMVVIPGGGEVQKPYAIGKYEISVGDYSKYCALTGKCKPVLDKDKFDEPQTDITIQDAEDYVKWLSERTGKHYRLPTPAEWEYAANADGQQPRKDFNCRVALGDKVIKGTGPVSVVSGQANGWGLKNYIGNVQEWTIDGGGKIQARGGAYEDSFSNCEISLKRPHNGSADNSTGFRVVLDGIG